MPEEIYILAPDGTPLMPTKRKRHVDALVKAGKARIVSQVPMVVQMLYEVKKKYTTVILCHRPWQNQYWCCRY